ncbi:pyridoxamine 5'-phosphate oxidase [Aggregatimonas sangjinii]|uniref:Pyridoxamine 5'-phosphate oxidase n=1 Tax=Aggregatimonas sangjinii TaxID=2583587 RepID=A0A5B7SJV9_9FLAO|nr:pyridoxal 5'-phosphate synthase [Aggregatimonas sangjinii]QCW98855.1 pyridoxamine 5'-phosphate oxidase [Aggregatimonas sangjinii]
MYNKKSLHQPLSLFSQWFEEEQKVSEVRIPTAVCLSTIGLDNFPNARFVSFKKLVEDCLIITGPLNSRKGIEIENNAHVALTFWWTATERQIRIQGLATKISEQLADNYFNDRHVNAQAVSTICEQGKETYDAQQLEKRVLKMVSDKTKITRPQNWGGFSINPTRIEFMEFKETRFHYRRLYERENGEWQVKQLQP